jgi:hypothetical protein
LRRAREKRVVCVALARARVVVCADAKRPEETDASGAPVTAIAFPAASGDAVDGVFLVCVLAPSLPPTRPGLLATSA